MAGGELAEPLPALLRADGSPFAEELAELGRALSGLPNDDRIAFRNRNAAAIANDDATHLLVVAGPQSTYAHEFDAAAGSPERRALLEAIYGGGDLVTSSL
ncbi:MAG TPA: hypothetical protein VI035_05820 [Solirubrobacterales bacterium]